MKTLAVISKSLREQGRQFWLVLLTVLMAPFFVGVYYLMWETSKLSLTIAVVNEDQAAAGGDFANPFLEWTTGNLPDSLPLHFIQAESRAKALNLLEKKEADAVLILPENFSSRITEVRSNQPVQVPFELSGDLGDQQYMLAAIYAHALITEYIVEVTGVKLIYEFKETPAGLSGSLEEFDLYVPGLLILSTIMLMFTAAIAFVRESEQNTIIRLKLSKVRNFELITGITLVQLTIGIISALLTLGVASLLGFSFIGSWGLLILITLLVCLSIVAFSLILAALVKTVNQILIVGNFPMFLFMFFTGAMMPIEGPRLFTLGGYDLTLPGLMSPYHAVQAIRKVSVYNAGFQDILPELTWLLLLTVIYFVVGAYLFRRRHLALQ